MLKNLQITNFRNFSKSEINFNSGINVINAPNASGKTNLLEAIAFLALGKSFKARLESECINYDSEIARIKTDDLEIVLTRGFIDIGKKELEKVPKKKLLVKGIARRLIDFAGNIKVVIFSPQDLDLVSQTPSLRRKFLDQVLSQSDREYRRSIGAYEKGIRQRNRILLKIREEGLSRENLIYWNHVLIKNGNYITSKREELIEYINNLEINIKNSFQLKYDPSTIIEERLEKYKVEEVASGNTLVGPHRDDFEFQIIKPQSQILNLSSFGSRGEQRMAVLWLKLAELNYIEERTGTKPILLLDDIFSELDHNHRKVVVEAINNHQVIITSADPHNLSDIQEKEINLIELCYQSFK